MSARAAALHISLDDFAGWRERERLVANVEALYRDFSGVAHGADAISAFASMAWLAHEIDSGQR